GFQLSTAPLGVPTFRPILSNPGDPKSIESVQQLLEQDIKERMQTALEKAQKQFKSDIFGFGAAVNRTYQKEWNTKFKQRWEEEFPRLEVQISPHVTVVRIGLTIKSLTGKEQESKK
ncbi:Ger(x)C family spore germination C-terminal domain-containing protein, partial [Effusibacillus consociatus]